MTTSHGAAASPSLLLRPARVAHRLALSWLLAGLAAFGVAWLWHLGSVALSPPMDNIEQLVWARSLQLGYYKHPPLPTWLLAPMVALVGWNAWASYLLGAAFTLGALAGLWRLARAMRGPRHATVVLLACLCITFYNGRLYYYNHNVVLMVLVMGCAASTWWAFARSSLQAWAWVGVCLGLGFLTKYQMAVAGLALLCFWLSQRGWRDPVHGVGLALASCLAAVFLAPHFVWLLNHRFLPITYAMDSSLGAGHEGLARVGLALRWLLDQLFNRALPAWLFLAGAAALAWRAGPARAGGMPETGRAMERAFLLCWGIVPLGFMLLLGMFAGADLQLHWGTPFLPLVVLAVLGLVRPRSWQHLAWAPLLGLWLLIQGALMAQSFVASPAGVERFKNWHWRFFPSQRLADQVLPEARARLPGPVRVVMGPYAEAGALALRLPGAPYVLMRVRGQYRFSPWVPEGLVERCGAVELFDAPPAPAPAPARGLPGPWSRLDWRIVPPQPGAGPCEP